MLAVTARRAVLVEQLGWLGVEVDDRELLDFPYAHLDVVITRKEMAGRTLAELDRERGHGIVLQRLVRAGQEIPFDGNTRVERGDLLSLDGDLHDVERVARDLGYADRPSPATDMVFVGMGIFLGGLFGLLAVTVGGVSITLTTSGGALISGLVFGWLRYTRPTFGRIPEAGLWIFDTVGLAAFIGIVGLNAGPQFLSGVRATGPGLIVAALLVSIVPHTLGLLFGRFVLKLNPVILLGAESGAGTTTAALRAVQDAAGSKLPVLGYTVPYAIGNILLTAWGPVALRPATKDYPGFQKSRLVKLYFTEICRRVSKPVAPPLSVRWPQRNSGPAMKFRKGVTRKFTEAYWPVLNASGPCRPVLNIMAVL